MLVNWFEEREKFVRQEFLEKTQDMALDEFWVKALELCASCRCKLGTPINAIKLEGSEWISRKYLMSTYKFPSTI